MCKVWCDTWAAPNRSITCAIPSEDILAWLKKILPKWSLSGNTSACRGRLAPPESTVGVNITILEGLEVITIKKSILWVCHRHKVSTFMAEPGTSGMFWVYAVQKNLINYWIFSVALKQLQRRPGYPDNYIFRKKNSCLSNWPFISNYGGCHIKSAYKKRNPPK